MGKKRNTGKTGDKSLYKKAAEARKNASSKSKGTEDGDDNMYDDVDKYHNQKDKDFMKFDDGQESESEEEVEAVMDLGVGGDSSSSESEDSDDSDDDSRGDAKQKDSSSSSSSSDDDDDEEIEDVRNWGKKKSAYYHGDTADLEIGQEEEDAFLEEEAAKEVQAARYEEMDEADFMLSDEDDDDNDKKKSSNKDEDKEATKVNKISSLRDISKLSSRDRKKLIEKQHPGLMQILSHFSESVRNLKDRTSVATKALFDGGDEDVAEAIGATKSGQKYLLTKALIESSTALNLAMFLLLKSEETSNDEFSLGDNTSSVQFHPVMKRLQECNVLRQKLKSKVEDRVDGLEDQVDSLIKAAEMMASDDLDSDEDSSEEEDQVDSSANKGEGEEEDRVQHKNADIASSSSDDESSVDEEARTRSAIHDARFGVRPSEMVQLDKTTKRKRRAVPVDVGDDGEAGGASTKYLSSAINSIEQRAASKKKKHAVSSEELVEQREADDQVRRGLEMMEEELGKLDSDEEGGDGEALADDIDSKGDDGFYSAVAKKSKRKKAIKKSLYEVAPKYPRLEGEVEGERAISRAIMKNRGLVPHKNKLNRNPRVKKREQYRKALIRRKGTVREVRTDEGHRYGGEETGIKRGISRSRKLGAT